MTNTERQAQTTEIELKLVNAKLGRAMSALESLEKSFTQAVANSHTKAEMHTKTDWLNGYYQGNMSGFKLAVQWVREAIDFEVNQPSKDPDERCEKCGNRNRACQCQTED